MPDIFGNTAGLSPLARNALERIYRRRIPLEALTTPELIRSLAEASRHTKRQVGALVHRSGTVEWVIVGSATGLMLPDVGRLRAAQGRFRGLRLIHSHLYGEPLTQDDLVDLTRLRLDLVAAVQLNPQFEPRGFTWAHCVPGQESAAGSLPFQVYGPQPWGNALPDFSELISALEDEFAGQTRTRKVEERRAMLIHVGSKGTRAAIHRARSSMRELESLANTAGVKVADSVLQLRDRPDPRLVMGKGKLEDVLIRAIELDVDLLIFDQELSPTQASSIAAQTDLHVIDRTQLILDIFAQRATTKDGKLQVELAQLKYRLPRLGQKDDALSRLTGGIGGRGPGETKLEIGRRRARERVTRLERELSRLAGQRKERRKNRIAGSDPMLAIVGYTNAGKSTLLNTLTGAGVLAEDKLFATLETRARRLRFPGGTSTVIADTVGFIRKMPQDLFAAFRSTFEEAADADVILEVVDASDPEQDEHRTTTAELIGELGLDHVPRITVINKIDLLSLDERQSLSSSPDTIPVSASDTKSARLFLNALETRLQALGLVSSPPPAPEARDEAPGPMAANEESGQLDQAVGESSS